MNQLPFHQLPMKAPAAAAMERDETHVKSFILQEIDANQTQKATNAEAAGEKITRKRVRPDRNDKQHQNYKKPRLEANDENSSWPEGDEPELSLEQLREKARLAWAKNPKSLDYDEAYDDLFVKYQEVFDQGRLPLPEDTVCSVVVHNLKCREDCYSEESDYRDSNSDYTVSLLLQHHGLYDLLLKVLEIPIKEKLTDGYPTNTSCAITFDGESYLNDHIWYHDHKETNRQIGGFCDPQDIQALKDLDLKSGQKGKLELHKSVSFDFYVDNVSMPPKKNTRYPIAKPKLSAELKRLGSHLGAGKKTAMENPWKRSSRRPNRLKYTEEPPKKKQGCRSIGPSQTGLVPVKQEPFIL